MHPLGNTWNTPESFDNDRDIVLKSTSVERFLLPEWDEAAGPIGTTE